MAEKKWKSQGIVLNCKEAFEKVEELQAQGWEPFAVTVIEVVESAINAFGSDWFKREKIWLRKSEY